ncbi:ABC transporter ATP-binding protein [Bdellovibrio sp. HCB2-146]|uniref:ABC transporter ATP-binding protein n=1 Tax=Bdellovibrio sp. HCB2-146 TaxID=3394362 RepID=UPI0039BC3EC2
MKSVIVENLSVQFGDFFAVRDVSFSVEKGEIFGFLGANGAGKTTTIRVLCGLLLPSTGRAEVVGRDVLTQAFEVKSQVGYMSQKFTLYEDLSVGENLAFTASLRKMDKNKYRQRQDELLQFIKFQQSLKTMVKDLPGGIKQQVSLVASMLHDPEIVFLDEPTAGVSPAYRQRFWNLIRDLAAKGKTMFVTTHYMDEAEQCGRIALMRSGELIALDSPLNLKKHSLPDRDPKTVSLEEVFIAQVEGKP